jgi:hypothetical protein
MIRKRALVAAVLALVLAPGLGAQQSTDPMQDMAARMQSMQQMMHDMHHMMMSMHGGATADGHDVEGGMPGMGMQGQGMMMGGMQGADDGLGALFTRPVADLALTEAQKSTLRDILAHARAQALEQLTVDQRARLEITTQPH